MKGHIESSLKSNFISVHQALSFNISVFGDSVKIAHPFIRVNEGNIVVKLPNSKS